MLTAAKVGVVEVEEIVNLGDIPPDQVHLPGIYVDRILLGKNYEKRIEVRFLYSFSIIQTRDFTSTFGENLKTFACRNEPFLKDLQLQENLVLLKH